MGDLKSVKKTFKPNQLTIMRKPKVEINLDNKWYPGSFISIKKGYFFRVTTFPGNRTTIYKAVENVEVKSTKNGSEYIVDCILV